MLVHFDAIYPREQTKLLPLPQSKAAVKFDSISILDEAPNPEQQRKAMAPRGLAALVSTRRQSGPLASDENLSGLPTLCLEDAE